MRVNFFWWYLVLCCIFLVIGLAVIHAEYRHANPVNAHVTCYAGASVILDMTGPVVLYDKKLVMRATDAEGKTTEVTVTDTCIVKTSG